MSVDTPARPGDEASPEFRVETGVLATMRRIQRPSRLRNRELLLLLFAFVVNGAAMVLVQLGAIGEVQPGPLVAVAGLAVLVLVLHGGLRVWAPNADPVLLPVAVALNGIGIAEIYRIDIAEKLTGWGAASTRQIVWSAIAMVAAVLVVALLKNYRVLHRYTYVFGFIAVVMLLLPLIPGLGLNVNGARVWISIGGVLSFQPGEVAKIALAIFFAGYLVRTRESLSMVGKTFLGMRFPRLRDLGPILVIWLLSMAVIVFQRDLGTALLYFGMFVIMLYMATGRTSWVLIGMTLFVGGAVVASQTLSYVNGRFRNWLDAFNPDQYEAWGGSHQLVQGIFGLAHGGLVGTGLGQGQPAITPLAESDYIFASLGEELGLAGVMALLGLYLIIVARGLSIGFTAQDDFMKLLAVGLSFTIALQVFIMVGGVTRVIPLTGLTTPFLAAGGSSLVANWIIVALLLRLSDSVRKPGPMVGAAS
ncbi:FtsW/RodA/SpoVE family cell cycle protein [Mycetocola reblochoni]|nr:FtsW/RodA/SpoVE family cell cycle protein [Mycetocola reblochoni]RLP67721.1 FtsW/RodA/SpoVE family cell cycle protein [Mycetocola reblochoni]